MNAYAVKMDNGTPVSLDEVLEARERRAGLQGALVKKVKKTLVSFTLHVPGYSKKGNLEWPFFMEGKRLIGRMLQENGLAVLWEEQSREETGYAVLFAVDGPAELVKKTTIILEEGHPLGQLFDADVIGLDGRPLRGEDFGRPQRCCPFCGQQVWTRLHTKAHSPAELRARADTMLGEYFTDCFAEKVADRAQRAMVSAVCMAPKPGLADRLNGGDAHGTSLYAYLNGACALRPYFSTLTKRAATFRGAPEQLLQLLRPQGILVESAMPEAGGANHRGAVFLLGMICAAAGYLHGNGSEFTAESLLSCSGRIASDCLRDLETPEMYASQGLEAYQQYQLTGARGEAATGFPHVLLVGLPTLRSVLEQGYGVEQAGIVTLLHLMAFVEDTGIAAKTNFNTMQSIQFAIRAMLHTTQDVEALIESGRALDRTMVDQGLAFRGCADLLAVTLLVHYLLDEREAGDSPTAHNPLH